MPALDAGHELADAGQRDDADAGQAAPDVDAGGGKVDAVEPDAGPPTVIEVRTLGTCRGGEIHGDPLKLTESACLDPAYLRSACWVGQRRVAGDPVVIASTDDMGRAEYAITYQTTSDSTYYLCADQAPPELTWICSTGLIGSSPLYVLSPLPTYHVTCTP